MLEVLIPAGVGAEFGGKGRAMEGREGDAADSFGRRLRGALDQRRWSQEDLARAIGTRQSTVSGWTRDSSAPSLDLAIRAAEALDVTMDYLFRGVVPPEQEPLTELDQLYLGAFRGLSVARKRRLLRIIEDLAAEEDADPGRPGAP